MSPDGMEKYYSTWTPRNSLLAGVNEVVSFGQQMFIKEFLIGYFNDNFFSQPKEKIVKDYSRFVKFTLGDQNPETKHIEDLHDLGYLPLLIKSIPEGTLVPIRVPMLTIENTDKRFYWLTNYLETLMSSVLWQPMTSATIAHEYKKILTKYALATGGDLGFVPFQGHDFSFRGMEGPEAATRSGMGHLLSFVGTDTCPSIEAMELYYNANIETELVGTSIPATEHSLQSTYGDDIIYFNSILDKHPAGFVSIVSDGYDFWNVVGRVLPALKDRIMARDGKVVIRPDSGDPVKIICGAPIDDFMEVGPQENNTLIYKGLVECLWDLFGGTVNAAGYRVLDSHIGCIYGDSITRQRATEISEQLMAKGFCSTNVVYGIGSFTYQYNTRDSLGFAVKSTYVEINGVGQAIFKDPKTGDGVKKSQKGKVVVFELEDGTISYFDGYTDETEITEPELNLLIPIFQDGKLLVDDTLANIRARLAK